jgi:transcriptional regulator with XRE-family HTH domain
MGVVPAKGDPSGGQVLLYSRGGPTVLRILLGARLRRLRESRGLSAATAGKAIRGTPSKISRMESGKVGFKQRDVGDLLTLYDVQDPDERATMLSLAQEANKQDWWHRYSDVLPNWFEVYISLEEAASLIRTYEVQFVPGLLQVEEYARAVVTLGFPDVAHNELEQRVNLRMTRQNCLTEPNAPRLWAVLDEAVLHRSLGGRAIMRRQLEHLIEITELPNVTIQILPFATGGHAAAGGAFTILRFGEPALPDVVYLEQLSSALYLDKPHELDNYMRVMNRLCVEAAPSDATRDYLAAILQQM